MQLTPGEHQRRESAMQRMLDNPMPRVLSDLVGDEIEPQTMNAGLPHGEVMICIEIAYPVIRDFLASKGN